MTKPTAFSTLKHRMNKSLARHFYLSFMRAVWRPRTPFLVGHHTLRIAEALNSALRRFRQGESARLIITLPFRHGKSDLASRYFPPFIFAHAPESEIMLISYAAALSEEFSREVMSIIRSPVYQTLFPKIHVAGDSRAVSRWGLEGYRGKCFPVGLGGSITGKGADILIIDDYLRNRAEAESSARRNQIWESFTNDLLTRLAPVHLCLVVATRWHPDDLIGRISEQMKHDPAFPKFEILRFPAQSSDYPGGYLFPERFSQHWYESQFSALGNYGSAALLQCDPVSRGGNLLKTDKIQYVDSTNSFPKNLRWVRFWDLASSIRQRVKDDPDYTVGTLAAVHSAGNTRSLYVSDVRRIRGEAPERNRLIISTALSDGPGVIQGVESVAGYKDTYTLLAEELAGRAMIRKINVSGDKIVRAEKLEPIFESGNLYAVRGTWTQQWIDELSAFPSGAHDDQVDSLAGACELAIQESRTTMLSTLDSTFASPGTLPPAWELF